MVRTILTPENTHIELDIPAEYVGKQIEVTFLSLEELNQKSEHTMSEFWGLLSKETGVQLQKHVEELRNEWERNI
jgi:hypothetical protein